jgi:hypothetical protein
MRKEIKPKKTKSLPWKRIWNEFDKEIERLENGSKCEECKRIVKDEFPDWDEQKQMIQRIVTKYLK